MTRLHDGTIQRSSSGNSFQVTGPFIEKLPAPVDGLILRAYRAYRTVFDDRRSRPWDSVDVQQRGKPTPELVRVNT